MRDFKGRTAVITGAGSGIGRATALALAREGANIVAADISAERAQATQDEVVALGGQALGVACDVSKEADLQALRQAALARFGRIDILMNNVGIVISGRFQDIGLDQWRRSLEVNLLSAVRALQLMLPDIEQQDEGHIVNVASTAALYPYNADRMPYNASKVALVNVSEAMAMDLAPKGIGVTCLCPGPVRTNIREQITSITPGLPITSPDLDFKEPEEVAEMVVAAIRDGIFFVPTNQEVHAIYAERGASPDKFLKKATKRLAEIRSA